MVVDSLVVTSLNLYPLFVSFGWFLFISMLSVHPFDYNRSDPPRSCRVFLSITRSPLLAVEKRQHPSPTHLHGGPSLLNALWPGPSNKSPLVIHCMWAFFFFFFIHYMCSEVPWKADSEMPRFACKRFIVEVFGMDMCGEVQDPGQDEINWPEMQ